MTRIKCYKGLILLVAILLWIVSLDVAADGVALRDRIIAGLSANTKSPTVLKTKPPTNAPTKKPTTIPTDKKTHSPISTSAPTKKGTLLPTSFPTKKATPSPTVKTSKQITTSAPSKKTTVSPSSKKSSSPVTSPTKATKAPSSEVGGTNHPAVSKSPTAKKGKTVTPSTPRPTVTSSPHRITAAASAIAPNVTETPTTVKTDAPTDLTATEVPSSDDATASPSAESSSQSPSSSPSSTSSPTTSPTSLKSLNSVLPTTSPTSPGAVPPVVIDGNATQSPSENVETTSAPSVSPVSTLVLSNSSTSAPSVLQSNSTTTAAPTTSDSNLTTLPTLKNSIAQAIGSSPPPSMPGNWTSMVELQLWLVKVAGLTSRSAAVVTLLALERACAFPSNTSMDQVTTGVADINNLALPVLRTNRTACDALLQMQDAQSYRVLREQLEFASASASLAIQAQERLVDLGVKVTSGNVSSTECLTSLTPKVLNLKQYDTQTESDDVHVSSIVFASLALTLGLILVVLHPFPSLLGSMIGFIIAAAYIWAYAAFMASWYAFNLSEADAWLSSTWWRTYYATYLIGLAAWLLFACLTGMLYYVMVRNPWFLGLWAGIAVGGVFGIQINTIGAWQLGYNSSFTAGLPWYTLACCMGSGAFLWLVILTIVSAVSPTRGLIQHITMIFVGSYLFVKSIGILVGSYPDEFDMSPPVKWETYVYISAMWLLTILMLIIQTLFYGIRSPVEKRPLTKRQSFGGSTASSRSFGEEEKVPLLPPVGSAADSRNATRQQEVSEFGGVRALRPDSENRRLFV